MVANSWNRRGDCGTRRCQRGDRGILAGEIPCNPRGQHRIDRE